MFTSDMITICLALLLLTNYSTVNSIEPYQCNIYNSNANISEEEETIALINPDLPNITIGFLSSFRGYGLGKEISGAIPLAVEQINRDPTLLPNFTLNFVAMDAGQPNTATSIRAMTDMRDQGVIAFIGPENSCVPEALVATAWNFPMITYKCADRTVSDKKLYSTFARTLPPGSKVSKSIISLLKHFNWNRIVLIVNDNPTDRQVEQALIELAALHEIQINSTYYLPPYYLTKHKDQLEHIIEDSYSKTRIYVLISDIEAVADYARLMQQRDLLTTGDYVIISIEDEVVYSPEKQENYFLQIFESCDTTISYNNETSVGDICEFNPSMLFPFRAVFIVTPSAPINPDYDKFKREVNCRNRLPPFNVPFIEFIVPDVPIYAGLAYDAVMIYAMAVTKLINQGLDYTNGTLVVENIKFLRYQSILGFGVTVDENGDAEGNYTLLALLDNPEAEWQNKTTWKKTMQPVGRFTHKSTLELPSLNLEREIDWISGEPPKSEPYCGFDNERCVHKPNWPLIISSIIGSIILSIVLVFVFRHYQYEYKLALLLWKIDARDLILLKPNSEYNIQAIRDTINQLNGTDPFQFPATIATRSVKEFDDNFKAVLSDQCPIGEGGEVLPPDDEDQFTVGIGIYKGTVVFVKKIFKRNIDLTRAIRKELIQIREMRHENINPFIGAVVDPPNAAVLRLYCARGSLEDVLKIKDIDLDAMFVASLISDLIRGMIYIHDSYIVSHGNLKSSNCLVDSRWVLQISDFGLHEFLHGQEVPKKIRKRHKRSLLWRAPELLRVDNVPPRGTQKGDVYSFAIILYEIIGRNGPYGIIDLSIPEILNRVRSPSKFGGHIFRPQLDVIDCDGYVKKCITECWDEDPDARPDFRVINLHLLNMQTGLKPNIFDNMISILEKYSYNLEGLVQERTNQLVEEKKKTENLLLRMLPKPVAEQLKRGEPVEAESFDSVTIYFSDIVGFTALSASSTPLQVVDLLNNLYTCFDSIIGNYDVYKVETIGDAYMVVSGLPIRNGDRHAGEIASLALQLLAAIQTFEIPHKPGERLKLRIGIHSGPCVAGVVGLKMPRYCLFGDTVNTASRMESTGAALKIHVSEACRMILTKLGGYIIQERGLTPVKGKGEMRTYWLVGKIGTSFDGYSCCPTSNDEPHDLQKFTDECLRDHSGSKCSSPSFDPFNLKLDNTFSNHNRWLTVENGYHFTNPLNINNKSSNQFASPVSNQSEAISGGHNNLNMAYDIKSRSNKPCILEDKNFVLNRFGSQTKTTFNSSFYQKRKIQSSPDHDIIFQKLLKQHSTYSSPDDDSDDDLNNFGANNFFRAHSVQPPTNSFHAIQRQIQQYQQHIQQQNQFINRNVHPPRNFDSLCINVPKLENQSWSGHLRSLSSNQHEANIQSSTSPKLPSIFSIKPFNTFDRKS